VNETHAAELDGTRSAARGLAVNKGQIHILRHTFCSHLAMRGVPAKVIQELAGHADLTTTMRYMHLAKGSKDAASPGSISPRRRLETFWRPRLLAEESRRTSTGKVASHRDSNCTRRVNHNPATTHAKPNSRGNPRPRP